MAALRPSLTPFVPAQQDAPRTADEALLEVVRAMARYHAWADHEDRQIASQFRPDQPPPPRRDLR